MPELPEVESIRRGLSEHLPTRTIMAIRTYVSSLRNVIDEHSLNIWQQGHRIQAIRRRGKYLIFILPDNRGVLVHLGMSGQLGVMSPHLPVQKYERVCWYISGGYSCRLMDQRRFSLVRNCVVDPNTQLPPELDHLGPEPLSSAFNSQYLAAVCTRCRASMKSVLLNQRVVAGLGNIYVNEALFRSQIRPDRPVQSLSPQEQQRLIDVIKTVLEEAIKHRGTTFSDYRDSAGASGDFGAYLNVYGKKDALCPRCRATARIQRVVQQGRSSYMCPVCQK